jgi:hypothetical protein
VALFGAGWLLGSSPDINLVDLDEADLVMEPAPWMTDTSVHAAVKVVGGAPEFATTASATTTEGKNAKIDELLSPDNGAAGSLNGMGNVAKGGMGGESLKVRMANIHNKRGVPDAKEKDPWAHKNQNAWRLIILFQHNYDMLFQAVESYRRASDIMAPNILIVDNSNGKEAMASKHLKAIVSEVVSTPRMLNFPQLHNFMADVAVEKNLEFYFWAHADNYVMPFEEGRDLGKDVIECMRMQIETASNWGMMLFSYDHLAAFRTQALVQVPWDPNVFQYGSECDAYGRLRTAGYDAKACKVHLSYDMSQTLAITDKHTYNETLTILEDDKAIVGQKRNEWRESQISKAEQAWRTRMKMKSRTYLEEKWKFRGCKLRDLPCHKVWPYCPVCPDHIPYCLSKTPTHEQTLYIHAEGRKVFATDPDQPEKFLLN